MSVLTVLLLTELLATTLSVHQIAFMALSLFTIASSAITYRTLAESPGIPAAGHAERAHFRIVR